MSHDPTSAGKICEGIAGWLGLEADTLLVQRVTRAVLKMLPHLSERSRHGFGKVAIPFHNHEPGRVEISYTSDD